jgi:hypothetical protein
MKNMAWRIEKIEEKINARLNSAVNPLDRLVFYRGSPDLGDGLESQPRIYLPVKLTLDEWGAEALAEMGTTE